MNLRDMARPFIFCEVHSGSEALFWHDDWSGLGPLINISGANGPRVSGISSMATVSQAVSGSSWALPRGRNRTIQLIRASLPSNTPSLVASVPDVYLWRNSQDAPPGVFSFSKTWDRLHPSPPPVSWFNSVWFKSRVPKHAFLTWVSVRNRLPTRNRLLNWGMNIPSTCLLCDADNESRNHIFFTCSYAKDVRESFFLRSGLTPPADFEAVINWVQTMVPRGKLQTICKLIFQAVMYTLWKERNLRVHSNGKRTVTALRKEIQLILKAKLYGMDKEILLRRTLPTARITNVHGDTYLQLWFRFFH